MVGGTIQIDFGRVRYLVEWGSRLGCWLVADVSGSGRLPFCLLRLAVLIRSNGIAVCVCVCECRVVGE